MPPRRSELFRPESPRLVGFRRHANQVVGSPRQSKKQKFVVGLSDESNEDDYDHEEDVNDDDEDQDENDEEAARRPKKAAAKKKAAPKKKPTTAKAAKKQGIAALSKEQKALQRVNDPRKLVLGGKKEECFLAWDEEHVSRIFAAAQIRYGDRPDNRLAKRGVEKASEGP